MEDIFVKVTEQNKPLAEFISSVYKVKKHCNKIDNCFDDNCPFHWDYSICSHGCLFVDFIDEMQSQISSVMNYNDLKFKKGIDIDYRNKHKLNNEVDIF